MREEICSGKSKILKNRYLEAMKNVLDILGPNRVGSCLLVGLEPIESSIKGAITLASVGVQPCILPFKPWDKSLYSDFSPCNPDDLIKISKVAVNSMFENDLEPDKNQGCLLCEGCTIDHDIYKLLKGDIKHENCSS